MRVHSHFTLRGATDTDFSTVQTEFCSGSVHMRGATSFVEKAAAMNAPTTTLTDTQLIVSDSSHYGEAIPFYILVTESSSLAVQTDLWLSHYACLGSRCDNLGRDLRLRDSDGWK